MLKKKKRKRKKITKNTIAVMNTRRGFRCLFSMLRIQLKRVEVQPPWPVTIIWNWKKRKLFFVRLLHRLHHFPGHSKNVVVFSWLREENEEEKMQVGLFFVIVPRFRKRFFSVFFFWTGKVGNVCEWIMSKVKNEMYQSAWSEREGFIGAWEKDDLCDGKCVFVEDVAV